MKELNQRELAFLEMMMKFHSGIENVVSSKELRHWGKGPEIREIIHNIRVAGYPIASCSKGYYYANSKAELAHTLNRVSSYIREMEKMKDGLLKAYDKLS